MSAEDSTTEDVKNSDVTKKSDDVKRFILENKKGLIVGAIAALVVRAIIR